MGRRFAIRIGAGSILLLSVAHLSCAGTSRSVPAHSPAPGSAATATTGMVAVDAEVAELIAALDTNLPKQRKEARERLLAIGPSRTVPALLASLEDPDFMVRWNAVNLLGYLEDVRALDPLIDRAVLDVNPHVRWRALWALAVLKEDDRITADLMRRLEDESQRWNAAVGLSMFAHPAAIPTLMEGLDSPDSWIRFEAVFGLGRSFDQNTAPALAPLLENREPRTRQEVTMSLGRIGDGPAVDGLLRALRDLDPGVRWRAAMGLKRARDPRVAPALTALLESEGDKNVRKYAQEALEAHGKPQSGRQ